MAQILKDFLTEPRREIFELFSLLSRELLRGSKKSTKERSSPVYRMHQTIESVSDRILQLPSVETVVCSRTLCRILAPAGILLDRVLDVLGSFACWSDACGKETAKERNQCKRPTRLSKSIANFGGLHAEVGTAIL